MRRIIIISLFLVFQTHSAENPIRFEKVTFENLSLDQKVRVARIWQIFNKQADHFDPSSQVNHMTCEGLNIMIHTNGNFTFAQFSRLVRGDTVEGVIDYFMGESLVRSVFAGGVEAWLGRLSSNDKKTLLKSWPELCEQF